MLAVLWDLDGVLADNSHAMSGHSSYHYMSDDEWQAFYAALDQCAVNEQWAALYQVLGNQPGISNIILTNRPEQQREVTRNWLFRHNLFPDMLLMRDPSVRHSGAKVNRLAEIQRAGYIVMLAIDDDPEHCNDYITAGIPSLYVPSGYHDDRQRLSATQ